LRFFGGLTEEEVGEVLSVSPETVRGEESRESLATQLVRGTEAYPTTANLVASSCGERQLWPSVQRGAFNAVLYSWLNVACLRLSDDAQNRPS
jgi:hypothetical protein